VSGGIVWKGDWNNTLDSGKWYLGQYINEDWSTYSEFSLRLGDEGDTFFMKYDSAGDHVSGNWSPASPDNRGVNHQKETNFPWIAIIGVLGFQGLTYNDVWGIGHNPHKTEPVTWAYTP